MALHPRMGAAIRSMKSKSPAGNLLQSGIIFTAISFVTSFGNMAFQAVLARNLKGVGDYSEANSALSGLMPLIGLLPLVATFSVTHYIAHFNTRGDNAQLQGLLMGCRKVLFWLTIFGSILAIIIIKPLSDFFGYKEGVMLVTLASTLLGLWASFATALCQGLAWFKRLALIGFLAMLLRILFGWFVTLKWPMPETAVLPTAFALLANLVLLFWRKDLALHGEPISPWNRELAKYFAVSAPFVLANYCFFQGDYLVANKYFGKGEFDAYTAAGMLARALPFAILPMLSVLFTSRSGHRTGGIVSEQLKLIGLTSLALILGAICLFPMRVFCLKVLGKYTPEASGMVGQFAMTMVFVGLLQSLAYWSLASRWLKISITYGVLGVAYWLTLFLLGKTPQDLLRVMPIAAGTAFAILFLVWLTTLRQHHSTV